MQVGCDVTLPIELLKAAKVSWTLCWLIHHNGSLERTPPRLGPLAGPAVFSQSHPNTNRSRTYYKAAEAITWSGFDMQPKDLAVEIGSAPGGACGRLLELGMRVIGIDPAEMDPRISGHPEFRHIRARAGDLKRNEFRGAKWLLVDSNVKPDKTLVTVKNIVNHKFSGFEGLLITLKIGDYESANLIDRWTKTIESWKPKQIRVRQLARNKCEVCFAVTM